jgi:hypothetical protein
MDSSKREEYLWKEIKRLGGVSLSSSHSFPVQEMGYLGVWSWKLTSAGPIRTIEPTQATYAVLRMGTQRRRES